MKNKKIIILCIYILFMSITIKAQFKIKGSLETGYFDEKITLNKNTYLTSLENKRVLYSDIMLNLSKKNLHLEQTIFNIFAFDGEYTFKPLEIFFTTRIYYDFKNISIGVEHMCAHPLIIQHNEVELITRRQSFDKIFIKFNFKNY